jgi:hypothetical protein
VRLAARGAAPVAKQIDPLAGRKLVGERPLGSHVFNADRYDYESVLARNGQFLLNLARPICIVRKHQDHNPCRADGRHYAFLEILTGRDVTRRNPAIKSTIFQRRTDPCGSLLVPRGMANEDRSRHHVRSQWVADQQAAGMERARIL